MFTGIIEEIGTVDQIIHQRNLSALAVRARKVSTGTKLGDSIAVDGVCLTVIKRASGKLVFEMMQETLEKTTLKGLRPKDQVNLERALKVGDRWGGHFVTGHADQVGAIQQRIERKNYTQLVIGLDKKIAKYIVPKGSVCLDGISLTVGEVHKGTFSVFLIPFTKQMTTLGHKKSGDRVNIETDILAKYIINRH
ncbi:MAG: riboflavin synthase [Candidatus Omnitrophota bacterium]|nr:riboflavin synthase [Candidatus Omnitrophota bacterium]